MLVIYVRTHTTIKLGNFTLYSMDIYSSFPNFKDTALVIHKIRHFKNPTDNIILRLPGTTVVSMDDNQYFPKIIVSEIVWLHYHGTISKI